MLVPEIVSQPLLFRVNSIPPGPVPRIRSAVDQASPALSAALWARLASW